MVWAWLTLAELAFPRLLTLTSSRYPLNSAPSVSLDDDWSEGDRVGGACGATASYDWLMLLLCLPVIPTSCCDAGLLALGAGVSLWADGVFTLQVYLPQTLEWKADCVDRQTHVWMKD